MTQELLYSGLISAAGQVSYFLVCGGIVAVVGLAAKTFIRNDEGVIDFKGVKIPLNYMWLVMTVLTLAHLFYSWALLVEVSRVLECNDMQLSSTAWRKLTQDAKDLRVLYGMSVREPTSIFGFALSMPSAGYKDFLMWLHLTLAFCAFAATIRWFRTQSWRLRILTTVVAVALIAGNWTAGSNWALLASDLSRQGNNDPLRMTELRDFVVKHSGAKCLK